MKALMRNAWNFAKNHKKSSIAVASTLGLGLSSYLIWGGSSEPRDRVPGATTLSGKRETIYEGTLDGWKVIYQEGNNENYLAARNGDVVIQMYDNDKAIPINKSLPIVIGVGPVDPASLASVSSSIPTGPLDNVSLERVVYDDGRGNKRDISRPIATDRFDTAKTREVMDEADKKYIAFRAKIRDEKLKELSGIREALK